MTLPSWSDTKLRGGYYTPPEVADFLAAWAIQSGGEHVLEPSCGDGNLLDAASRRLRLGGRLTAVELSEIEAQRARARGGLNAEVFSGDVFEWYANQGEAGAYDAVLGNPPFIRYQNFPEEHRERAFELMRSEGLKPTRLTNAWLPFVVLATVALRDKGRLALVLPAELLQVGYAAELREYLARNYQELTIVTFRKLIFKGIQQETVLLMGVRAANSTSRIVFREVDDLRSLADLNGKHDSFTVDLDHAREKWTQYYLSSKELALVRELERSKVFTTLGALVEVDVGIVTGRNEFFVITPAQADVLGIRRWCLPIVGRSAQIPGVVLSARDWNALADSDGRCLLVNLPNIDRADLDASSIAYVAGGELNSYDQGYKCRVRLPRWWWVPDAFLLRQIYDGPRLVLNGSQATSTDTIHRVRVRSGIRASAVVASAVNSLTFAFAEIRGRSYGGGVLELEPTEAEALPFPVPTEIDLAELDVLFRKRGVNAVLDHVDNHVLAPAGLNARDISILREIWRKLASRRLDRNRRVGNGFGRQSNRAHVVEDPYTEPNRRTQLAVKTVLAGAGNQR